jgi:hypothetical protein
MKNTLKNHSKIFGVKLGVVSWNSGFDVDKYYHLHLKEPFTEYLKEIDINIRSGFEVGDYVNLMWFDSDSKTVKVVEEDLRVTHVNGVFLSTESFGDKSYNQYSSAVKSLDKKPSYSYGYISGGKWMFKLVRKVNAE